ncbi:MAG: short-chain dehydrogenase [Cycloclasticus sp.]|nr:short-chain dehydrogenase [Cycloclasticus sp.]
MDFRIKGRVAFVAGGSQGMGAAAAEMLAAEGCRVAVVARDQGRIDAAVKTIREAGGEAMGISADLATEAGIAAAVAEVKASFGAPEIVVAQTNDMTHGNFFDVTEADFSRVFQVLTMSFSALARAVIPDMKQAGWGRIVHIGSLAAKEPPKELHHIVHSTVRAATSALIKSLADEVARYEITINTVAPGYIMTDTMRQYFEEKYGVLDGTVAEWVETTRGIPAQRHGTTEEISSLITYLCSQQAGYINGEWISVDGALHQSVM